MVRFPSHVHDGEGVITEVLGPRGKPGVDTLSIIREFNLPERFPEDALDEARERGREVRRIGPGGPARPDRRDDRHDRPGRRPRFRRRDFAGAAATTAIGGWASTLPTCRTSSARRRPWTARRCERATSVYLPDRVLPMLPEMISNGLASLQPGKVRYTKIGRHGVHAEGPAGLDRVPLGGHPAAASGSPTSRSTSSSPTRSRGDSKLGRQGLRPAGAHARAGHDLAAAAHGPRGAGADHARGEGGTGPAGRVCGAHVVENTESHQIIEEFMLAANEAVAEMLRDRGIAVPPPHPPRPQPAQARGPGGVRRRIGPADREPGKPLRVAEAARRRSPDGPSSTPSISPCCGRCSGRSTVPRRKATTPWPASATAISPRPSAAIPT